MLSLATASKPIGSQGHEVHETVASLCSKFLAALFCDEQQPDLSPLSFAFNTISEELETLGLNLLLNKEDSSDTEVAITAALKLEEQQALIDDIFVALYFHEIDPVIMSQFLSRIWRSSRLIPSALRLQGIKRIASFPFATTASSNVSEGVMEDGTLVALKMFRRTRVQPPSEEAVERFFFEALVSSTTQHRNIMPILGIHVDLSDDIYLASKLQSHGSLPDYLITHPEADRLLILEKLADAVVHIHNLPIPILHGDIRGLNILMDGDGEPLLIDFGFAMIWNPLTQSFCPPTHHMIGNPRWTPHEKLRPTEFPLTFKADSFSFASLMLEVLSDNVPYSYLNNNSAVIIEVVVRNRAPRRPAARLLTDPLWDIMNQCWSLNPHDRPSMESIHHSLVSARSELSSMPLYN